MMSSFFENKCLRDRFLVGGGKGHRLRRFGLAFMLALVSCASLAVSGVALASPSDEGAFESHEVETVSPSGTTIDLFDYVAQPGDEEKRWGDIDRDTVNYGINKGHQLKFLREPSIPKGDANVWIGASKPPLFGLVEKELEAGYPVLAEGNKASDGYVQRDTERESLAYLFNADSSECKKAYKNVGGLLQISDDGYYYYNSDANFASFDEVRNSFRVYDKPAVERSSWVGQFFPFQSAEEVFDVSADGSLVHKMNVDSRSADINHWLGMSMKTNFEQPEDGVKEDGKTPMTFEFSGDDDVWIFIDGVLVADVGGIHDAAGVKIDFSTGVVSYNIAPGPNSSGKPIDTNEPKTIREAFELAGRGDPGQFEGNTFADNSYHRLSFFYLERGHAESNLDLKFNLVEIPESYVEKVDQRGQAISGASFDLYAAKADDGNEVVDAPLFSGTTDEDGKLYFHDENEVPLSFRALSEKYGTEHFILRESKAPAGYRKAADVHIGFDPATGIVYSENHWDTGAFTVARELVTAPKSMTVYGKYGDVDTSKQVTAGADGLSMEGVEGGMLFAVALHRDPGSQGDGPESWRAVYGNALNGEWETSPSTAEGNKAIVEAIEACENEKGTQGVWDFSYRFGTGYQASIDQLPGDVTQYHYVKENLPNGQGKVANYALGFYYTTANDLSQVNESNIYVVDPRETADRELFNRSFAASFQVPDMKNRLVVQKLDAQGTPIAVSEEAASATFSLFKESDVLIDSAGEATVRDGAQAVQTIKTKNLQKGVEGSPIDLEGAAVFEGISAGAYYVIEEEAPAGYAVNSHASKVVVDDAGVYVNAGDADDGISTLRGVGTLSGTMKQFVTNENLDTTLKRITVAPLESRGENPGEWASSSAASHMRFGSDNAVLEYGPEGKGDFVSYEAQEGWTALDVAQCKEHSNWDSALRLSDGQSLNGLFDNTVVVRFNDQKIGQGILAGKAALKVSKEIAGRDWQDGESFRFVLEAVSDNAPMPEGVSSSGKAELVLFEGGSTGNFGDILYDVPGKYSYKITESGSSHDGLQFSKAEYRVDVTVEEDDRGSLRASSVMTCVKSDEGEEVNELVVDGNAVFVNTYRATTEIEGGTPAQFSVKKDLTGRPMAEGEFSFAVATSPVSGTPEVVANAANNADGTVSFGPIDYTTEILTKAVEDGYAERDGNEWTLHYSAYEITDDLPEGVSASSSSFDFTVVICDDGKGVLTARVELPEGASFENIYSTGGPVAVRLNGVKRLAHGEGLTPDSIAGKFTFTVKGEEGAPMPEMATSTNDELGNIDFGRIEFTLDDLNRKLESQRDPSEDQASAAESYVSGEESGQDADDPVSVQSRSAVFTYEIVETGKASGVTNDSSDVRKVSFRVIDHGNGVLSVVRESEGEDAFAFSFTNSYSVEPVEVSVTDQLVVAKTLEGRSMVEGEFLFEMIDKRTGDVIASGVNSVDGKVVFDSVRYTSPGEFDYVIREKVGEDREIVYDDSEYVVHVSVVDNGDGTLSVKHDAGVGEVAFRNSVKVTTPPAPEPPLDVDGSDGDSPLSDSQNAVHHDTPKTNDPLGLAFIGSILLVVSGLIGSFALKRRLRRSRQQRQ